MRRSFSATVSLSCRRGPGRSSTSFRCRSVAIAPLMRYCEIRITDRSARNCGNSSDQKSQRNWSSVAERARLPSEMEPVSLDGSEVGPAAVAADSTSRLEAAFERGRPALICYLPLGDPSAGEGLAELYADCGVDILEIGVP